MLRHIHSVHRKQSEKTITMESDTETPVSVDVTSDWSTSHEEPI